MPDPTDFQAIKNHTTPELCERWRVAPRTLRRWARKGVITPMFIGGKNIYTGEQIAEAEVNASRRGLGYIHQGHLPTRPSSIKPTSQQER